MGRRRLLRPRDYNELGAFLRGARKKLLDTETGKPVSVKKMSDLLGVKPSFVYQVEQGKKKPNDGQLASWSGLYGVRYAELCKRLGTIPMDLVASLKEEPEPVPTEPFSRTVDPFSQLTEEERTELIPFLHFVRWEIGQKTRRGEQ